MIDFEYRPLPVHEPFHKSTAKIRVMFGAFGSGKSYAVLAEAVAWCLEQPGIVGAVARKTVPQLRDAEEPIILDLIPYDLLKQCEIKRSGGHIERIVFPFGSEILFRSVDDPTKWRSLNLGFIAIDEMNELGEAEFQEIFSRVRQVDITPKAKQAGYTHKITRRGIFGATNPAGHDWIWRMVHPDSKNRRSDTEMFVSTTLDNPYLAPDYVEGLLSMPAHYVKRFVLCYFDDFAGQIYEEWGYSTHVVKDMKPEAGRVFWMGMDPGTRNPTAGLWVWNDIEGRRLVGVADYEAPGLAVIEHVAEWRKIEAMHRMTVRWRVADPNAITQRDRGTGIALQTQYAKQGYQFALGTSNEQARITALGQLINLRQFVVTESCERTFEAIRQYQWKDLTPAQAASGEDPKEAPLKRNTHLVECAQFLAGKQRPTPKLQAPLHPDDFQDEIWRAVKKQQRNQRRPSQSHELGGVIL